MLLRRSNSGRFLRQPSSLGRERFAIKRCGRAIRRRERSLYAIRRHDLAAEVYHLKEPQKLPLVMSPDETKRLVAMARNIKVRVVLSLGYGCGLRAGEVVLGQRRAWDRRAEHVSSRVAALPKSSEACQQLPLHLSSLGACPHDFVCFLGRQPRVQ
jgi:integrase